VRIRRKLNSHYVFYGRIPIAKKEYQEKKKNSNQERNLYSYKNVFENKI
jgi:hypothetical protein